MAVSRLIFVMDEKRYDEPVRDVSAPLKSLALRAIVRHLRKKYGMRRVSVPPS